MKLVSLHDVIFFSISQEDLNQLSSADLGPESKLHAINDKILHKCAAQQKQSTPVNETTE